MKDKYVQTVNRSILKFGLNIVWAREYILKSLAYLF